jgi:hypothetical protein
MVVQGHALILNRKHPDVKLPRRIFEDASQEKRKIPLTREEHATANRNADHASRAMLEENWNRRKTTPEGEERIKAAFARAQDGEQRRLRGGWRRNEAAAPGLELTFPK